MFSVYDIYRLHLSIASSIGIVAYNFVFGCKISIEVLVFVFTNNFITKSL